jgi:NAD(P)-dependent dehydrogenase (short-subunit alcohol dehydrogenase family)
VDLAVFDRTISVNLRGFLLCTRHAIPRMLERGGGAIVYTSSAAGHVGEPQRPSYGISKSGINALMRHVSSRWGREGIRANCVAPGLVLTKTIRDNSDDAFRDFALSLGRVDRLGEPEDIAAAVAFLMSDDAAWITAQVLSVDGGSTVRP